MPKQKTKKRNNRKCGIMKIGIHILRILNHTTIDQNKALNADEGSDFCHLLVSTAVRNANRNLRIRADKPLCLEGTVAKRGIDPTQNAADNSSRFGDT